ncbi:unnamed protein product [Closterium sp. NIES-64]|nr:unnamed protein product [Closterium sp. NIES-64]
MAQEPWTQPPSAMTSTSPNNAAATALRSLLDFGNSLLSELLRFRANLPRDFLRSITLPAPPPLSTSTQLNPTQIPSPSPDLPFPLWDFEYLRAPDDRERELRDRQDEWSAERAWWTAHGEQLVGFVLLLAAVLKLYRALRQTIEGLRRGLFLGSSLEGVVGGDEGDEMQSLLLQVLHTHALLLLLLHHLFPNQSRERLLIAAYRHWCRTSGPGSGEALGEILTRDFDDLCQMCRTTGAGSGEPEAYKGTAGGKKLGSKAHDGSSSASSDTDVFLWSPFPRECFDIEKLGLVSGLDSGWGVALGSGLGSEGSGLGIGGAETAAFLSLPCVIAPTDTHSLEQLFSRFAPPPDVTWMAIQSLLRKQAAAIDSSPASSSTFNLAPSVVSSSHSSSVHASTFSSFPPTQAPSQAGAAGAAAAHTPHDPLSAVAAVTASLPSTSSLILLLFFHPSSLCADLPFMHELVRCRLLALPPSSPSSSSAPPAAAAATAGGGWSLWKQRAPPQQQQGGSRGDDGGGGGAGGAGVVAAVGAGRSVDDPAAGGAGAGAAAGAAAVGGLTWVVPIFLGFSLDLSIAWQHFPAARSALTLHLSPTSILHVAQVLVQVLPGVQQAVGRAMGRLKQQGASGWEEELWGGKHVGVLRSAREILSLIRHTAALLRWLLQHRASLTLHLSLPIILTTHRLARSAQLHAQSCARVAAAAGLSSPGWSEASQVAAEVAAGFLLPEVTEAATCLSAIIARREDSWHCLRQAACARLDGLARLFVGGQGVEGGERGAADGADRGGVETGSRGGDRRGVGDGGEGMAGMGWKDGADGSIGEWFQRLSWQVSHWQHPDAPSTPASLQQLSLALADAASLHHIQSHPLAGQSLHATCRLLQDMALVQAIRSDHLAALSAAAEPGFLWALLPSLLPWLQARVRLQPECLGQVGCLLVLMRSGVAGASVGTAGSSSADSGGTGKHVHARASAASAGAGGVGGGGEFRARAGRTIAAGAATDVAGTAAAAGAGAGGRGEYLERHLRCVSRAVIAVVPASVLSLMHACTLALLPPPSHALATHSLNTDSTAGEGVASTQGRQGGLGEAAEGQGGESKAQVAARVHGQAVFRQAMGRARAAVAGFSAGVAAFEAKGLPFIGREGGARRIGTSRNSSSTGASSTGGMKSRDEWAAGACHAMVVALRLMLRRHAASILHTGFSEALKALHGAGLRQRGGGGKGGWGQGQWLGGAVALQQARGETERKGTSGYRSHPSTSANGGTFLEAALSSLLVLSHPSHAMFLPPLAAWFLPSGLPSLSLPLILRLASCLSATGRIPSTPPSNPPAAATGTTHTASAPPHAALAGGVASLTGEGAAGAGEEGPGVARTAEGLVALDWALRRAEEERLRRAVQVVSAMEKERRRVLLWLVEELREGGVQRCEQGEEVGGGEQRHVRKAKVAGSGGGGGRGEAEVAASVGRAAKSAVSMGRHVLAAYGRAEHGIAQPMAQGEACDAGVGGHGSISTAGRGGVGGAGKDGALKAGAAAGEPGAGAGRVAATAPSSAKRGPGENMGDFAGTVTGVVRALAEAGQVRLVRGLVRMAACAATGCETPAAARSVECLLASLHPHAVAPAHTAAAATAVTSSLSPDTAAASTSTTSTSSCSNDCVLTVQLLVLVSLSHLRLLLLDPSLACLSRRTRSANAFDASCLAAGICCLLSTLPNPREKIVLYEGCMEDYGNAEVAVGGLGSGLEESEVHWVLSGLSFSSAVRGTELATRSLPAVPQLAAPRGLGVTALFSSRKAAVPAKSVPATNLRTEDGIFGTSGGFGFTKANELFVGRVAMLGFAASLLGEAITGAGILSQLNIETGIPITETEPLLLFFIAFTVLGAIGGLGDRGRFVDDEPVGPPVKPGSIKAALGLSEDGPLFGFTKANELFVGRLAQLGFAASLIGEVITGRGALAQLNIEIGVPVWELEPLLLASIAFFFVAAINPGTGKFINDDE